MLLLKLIRERKSATIVSQYLSNLRGCSCPTYVPTDNDIQQHELPKSKPSSLVNFEVCVTVRMIRFWPTSRTLRSCLFFSPSHMR